MAGALVALLRSPAAPAEPTNILKITTQDDGLYSLDRKQLESAGLVIETWEVTALSLTQDGKPIPYVLQEDSLIFYGQASSSRYTADTTYILQTGMAGLAMTETEAPSLTSPQITSIPRQLFIEENYEYVSEWPTGDEPEGPWFWRKIRNETTIPFELPPVADGSGSVQINFYGETHNPEVEGDHSVALLINGNAQDEIIWDGQVYHLSDSSLPAGTLQTGTNTLTLQNIPEDYLDFMNLDWISLTYQANPQASDGWVDIRDVEGQVSLTNFRQEPLLFDITQPLTPTLLTNWRYDGDTATLGITADMHVMAMEESGFLTPAGLTPLRQNNWQDPTHQADLIILTTNALADEMTPLITARQEQGLGVALIPIQDIYDEFGYGSASPESITAFLQYANDNWADPKPSYLLLVGDATIDYRGYMATRPDNPIQPPTNIIPPYIVPVNFSGETVSDARLADLDGDFTPDLAVGRWPVDTPEHVRSLVNRTLAYEQTPASIRTLFAADGTEPQFETISNRLIVQSGLPEDQAQVLAGAADTEVASSWNEGAWLVTYTGHGSRELWGKDTVFSAETVNQLSGDNSPPIVLQLTCLSGLYSSPDVISLTETMMTHEQGPVLLIGATSLTLSSHQEPFAVSFLGGLQNPNFTRIGDALQLAKSSLDVTNSDGLREISDTFILFGDPSALINRPDSE